MPINTQTNNSIDSITLTRATAGLSGVTALGGVVGLGAEPELGMVVGLEAIVRLGTVTLLGIEAVAAFVFTSALVFGVFEVEVVAQLTRKSITMARHEATHNFNAIWLIIVTKNR